MSEFVLCTAHETVVMPDMISQACTGIQLGIEKVVRRFHDHIYHDWELTVPTLLISHGFITHSTVLYVQCNQSPFGAS